MSSDTEAIEAVLERSRALLAAGQVEENLAFLAEARGTYPTSPEIQLEFAFAVADVDRETGLDEARRVLELGQLDPLIELRCGFLLLNLGDPRSARDCVSRIRSRITSDWPWGMDLLHLGGRIALAANNRDLAEQLLSKAFEGEPENPDNGFFLARLYRDEGNEERARQVAEEALQHAPDNARLRGFVTKSS